MALPAVRGYVFKSRTKNISTSSLPFYLRLLVGSYASMRICSKCNLSVQAKLAKAVCATGVRVSFKELTSATPAVLAYYYFYNIEFLNIRHCSV